MIKKIICTKAFQLSWMTLALIVAYFHGNIFFTMFSSFLAGMIGGSVLHHDVCLASEKAFIKAIKEIHEKFEKAKAEIEQNGQIKE